MIFVGRCQAVLVACEQVFDFGFDLHLSGVRLRVFGTLRTADDVYDRSPEEVAAYLARFSPSVN